MALLFQVHLQICLEASYQTHFSRQFSFAIVEDYFPIGIHRSSMIIQGYLCH